MSRATLHHIYDPFCGWCYAAAPLAAAARAIPGLALTLHGGGMMAGSARQKVTPELRRYVMPHDHRIAQLTGQPFGDAYFNGLLLDTSAVLDSEPPIAAILAADRLGGRGLDMLERVQTAHYVEGRRIADKAALLDLASAMGLDAALFGKAFSEAEGEAVQVHIRDTRQLMARLGAQGFPSFALELEGQVRLLDIGPFLGNPAAFAERLQQQVPADAGASQGGDFLCGPDSCAI